MKVLLQFLEIRWSWHFKYWKSTVLSKPTIIKWILNSELLQCSGVQCTIHHLERAYCVGCNNRPWVWNVAAICGHFTGFGLCDGVVNSLWLKAVMSFFLRLGSDLEISIQRKLCSDTPTLCFVLQSQFVCNSPLEVEPAVLILSSRLKVITCFFWPPQRVPRLSSAQCAFMRLSL